MNKWIYFAALLLLQQVNAQQLVEPVLYGVAETIEFTLLDVDGTFLTGATDDLTNDIMVDEGCDETTVDEATNSPYTGGATYGQYRITLSAAELTAEVTCIYVDSDSDDVDYDEIIRVSTYGHPSARHFYAQGDAAVLRGAAEGTPSTTSIQTDLESGTFTVTSNDVLIGRIVIFTSGAAQYEATSITDYDGSNGTLTVTALANAPSAADTFIIL